MIKKICLLLFSIMVGLSIQSMSIIYAQEIQVTAKAAVVIEAETGKVLFEKNAYERKYPASTTKILTLITALENSNLDDLVTTSENASGTEGSSLWLSQGEKLTMRDMLYGIMLVSGNDATVAVAEHIAGSVNNFAKLMNKKAKSIGAKNSNFVNTSGLPDENHYTTAYDLAIITAYGYKNPVFSEIVSTQHRVMPWEGKPYNRDLYNENRLLYYYDGANGVKTGYTEAAGRCLVSAAKRSGVQLIAVVLDSEQLWDDSTRLLDYGFSRLKPVTMFHKGEVLKTVRLTSGKKEYVRLVAENDAIVPLVEEEKDKVRMVINAPNQLDKTVNKDEVIGEAVIYYENRPIKTVNLVAEETVYRKSLFKTIIGTLWSLINIVFRNFA